MLIIMKNWVDKKSYTRRLKSGKKITVKTHKQRYRRKIVTDKRFKENFHLIAKITKEMSYIDEMEALLAPYIIDEGETSISGFIGTNLKHN